jgi:four helix bundle protein
LGASRSDSQGRRLDHVEHRRGFGRYSRAELRQFLSIARGSATEVQSQLYLALELRYISEAEHRMLNERCVEVSRMIAAFRASIDRA